MGTMFNALCRFIYDTMEILCNSLNSLLTLRENKVVLCRRDKRGEFWGAYYDLFA